jgi:hypothetical protein
VLEAQPAALSASDQQDGDLALVDGFLTQFAAGGVIRILAGNVGDGVDRFRSGNVSGLALLSGQLLQFVEIKPLELTQEVLLLGLGELIPPGQDVFLVVLAETVPKFVRNG